MCCPVFRKLAVFDTWSRLVVHVAMDNTVVIQEISEYNFQIAKTELNICSRYRPLLLKICLFSHKLILDTDTQIL